MRFTARPAEELILVILITFEFVEKITFKLISSTSNSLVYLKLNQ
jgi:hypothetical protein